MTGNNAVPGLLWPGFALPGEPVTGSAPPGPAPDIDPAYLAARCGLPGDSSAVNYSAQIDQFLASHAITPLYAGAQLVTPAGNVGYGYGGIDWLDLGSVDIDQPFTMPGGKTVIGRVTLPLSPVGNGADVTVSLCQDSGGSPGAVITSVTIPAAHLLQLTAPDGLPGNPLATAQSNTLRMGDMAVTTWASPVAGSGSPTPGSAALSGNYLVQAGGAVYGSTTPVAAVYTTGWNGDTTPGTVLPQPPLPVATYDGALIATSDTLLHAGGLVSGPTATANVWAAGWAPDSGQVQAWNAQNSLPVALSVAAGAFDPSTDTVYVIGGTNGSFNPVNTVYYAQIVNGQLGSWKTGPPLPVARTMVAAGVVNGWLVVAGGQDSGGSEDATVWASPITAGVPGPWAAWPSLPYALETSVPGCCYAVTSSGVLVIGGFGASAPVYQVQALTVTADGPGQWQSQVLDSSAFGLINNNDNTVAAFSLGSGQWQVVTIGPPAGQYASGVLSSVPSISVPLPATGLTGGGTYHLLLHQANGDAADYVQAAVDPGALATAAQTRPNGGGSWTGLTNTYSLFAGVYDQTPGGPPFHLWEDSGACVVTLIWAGGTGELLGAVETISFPSGAPEAVLCAVTQVTYGANGQPAGTVQLA